MDHKLADRLVESGLDSIVVALDGATDESYESYRAGGSMRKALDTLDLLHYAKTRHNSKTPLVNLRMVVTKDNKHEVPLMHDIAPKHKADMLAFRGVAMTELWDDQKDDRCIPKEQSYSMYKYDNGARVMGFYKCRRPWKRATVAWDGTFVSCEMDYSNSAAYGAFPDDGPAAAIWNGSRARRFRAGS